jgi:hypothetical protein
MPGRGSDKGHGFDEMGHEITPMKMPQTRRRQGIKDRCRCAGSKSDIGLKKVEIMVKLSNAANGTS